MKKVLNTAILALASVSAMPRDVDKTAYENLPTVSTDDFKQLWTDATIDHYNYQDTRTYKQRYWINDKYFDKKNGPVFLYICGEYTCGIREDRLFPFMVGASHNGLLLALEHRYYGYSQPFDSWDTENLRYLTTE